MDEKEELISEIQTILGGLPDQTRLILSILVHPRIIEGTKRYVRSRDESVLCTKFKAPWSCIREAEAKFENTKYGWLGAGPSEIQLEWCCSGCMKRITED